MKQIFIYLLFSFLFFTCKNNLGESSIVNLKCEHLINPIGIDSENPRLSWMMDSKNKGISQSAYQIIVGTDSHFTLESQIWDSGKMDSDKNIVKYTGPDLKPFTKYFWGVQIWENHGGNSVSKVAFFETGMIKASNWKGSWITDTRDIDLKPAPYFRKGFDVKNKVKSAKAYIAVAGLFEITINGKKIGDHSLDPMYTRFDRRTLFLPHS